MPGTPAKSASTVKVLLAFAAIYIIWGSTYYGIREALTGFPPFLLGGLRFLVAALLMFGWSLAQGVSIHPRGDLRTSLIVGFLLLFVGNGAVVWVERTIASSAVAIVIAVAPLMFVLLDKPQWRINLRSWSVLLGVFFGFAGVLLLFSEKIAAQWNTSGVSPEFSTLLVLLLALTAWPAGSIYSKYNPTSVPATVSTGWQMLMGGACFLLVSAGRGELQDFHWAQVPLRAWLAEAYLIVFGSIIGYSAYVWLLTVRPTAQVSTYAYVNPIVAVVLGVALGNEPFGWREAAGLVIILGGVLMINLAKYRVARQERG